MNLPDTVECPECGHKGELGGDTLYPIWEWVQEHEEAPPDYLGCKACSTMSDWGDVE